MSKREEQWLFIIENVPDLKKSQEPKSFQSRYSFYSCFLLYEASRSGRCSMESYLFFRTDWSFVDKNNLTFIHSTKVIHEFFLLGVTCLFDLAMVTLQVAHVFLLSKNCTKKNDKNRRSKFCFCFCLKSKYKNLVSKHLYSFLIFCKYPNFGLCNALVVFSLNIWLVMELLN